MCVVVESSEQTCRITELDEVIEVRPVIDTVDSDEPKPVPKSNSTTPDCNPPEPTTESPIGNSDTSPLIITNGRLVAMLC